MGSNRMWKIFDKFTDLLAFLACLLLLFMTLSISYTVITRYLHLNPPIWTIQINEYILLWITFLGTAWLLRRGGHVRMDLIVSHLDTKARGILNIISSIFGGVVCSVIVWFSGHTTWDLFKRGILDVKSIDLPKYALFVVIPLGCFLLLIQFIRNAHTYLKMLRTERGKAIQ